MSRVSKLVVVLVAALAVGVPAAIASVPSSAIERVRLVGELFDSDEAMSAARTLAQVGVTAWGSDTTVTVASTTAPSTTSPPAGASESSDSAGDGFAMVTDGSDATYEPVPDGLVLQSPVVAVGMFPPSGVCPVASSRFIDSWLFPRPNGRVHQGTDMFADMGTPVVAVTDAVIVRVDRINTYDVRIQPPHDLGGLTVSYRISTGDRVYNAHLSAIPERIVVGLSVSAGTVIGYVGNSGNAATTPPHLHLGWYTATPDGMRAVDAFSLLDRLCG